MRSPASSRSGRPTSISEDQIRGSDARYNGRRVFKVLLLGESDVGKSSLLERFINDHFSHTTPTIGVDMKMRDVIVDGVRVKLQIWDTAGQERFRVITRAYYAGADGVAVMYDGNQRDTFDSLPYWFDQIADNAPSTVSKVLLCCQSDRLAAVGAAPRVVPRGAAEAIAAQHGAEFFETSAKTGVGVDESFNALALRILTRMRRLAAEDEAYEREEGGAVRPGALGLADARSGPCEGGGGCG